MAFPTPSGTWTQIRRVAGEYIEGMTPVVTVPAMLTYEFRGHQFNRQILLIGIDENTHASVSDFAKYLQHPDEPQAARVSICAKAATTRSITRPPTTPCRDPTWSAPAGRIAASGASGS